VLFADNFVGEAELSLLSENCVTEGRRILALTGASDVTYGSLTVEVIDVGLRLYDNFNFGSKTDE